MRPIDVVNRLCPAARDFYRKAIADGDPLFTKYGVTTNARLSQFLAQIFHESGGLTIAWESGNYSAERLYEVFGVGRHSAAVTRDEAQRLAHNGPAIFERVYGRGNPIKAKDLGNTEPGDGWRYRGGGLMQTTGRDNYRRVGQKIGVDLEANPSLVLDPEHALKPALVEWDEGHLNYYADKGDVLAISRKINLGSVSSTKKPNGLDDRINWLRRITPLKPAVSSAAAPPAPPSAPSSARPELRVGSTGPDVRLLQELLRARNGATIAADGDFGPLTRSAVINFQIRSGLVVNGVVDAETWTKLET